MTPVPRLADYVAVTFAFAVTPGATTAVVVRSALASGWRGGVMTALGAAAGNVVQATLAGVGLAVLLRQWPAASVGLRVAGAGYLAWLGCRSLWRLREARPGLAVSPRDGSTQGRWRQGLVANTLNPSIGTFYMTVVPNYLGAPRVAAPFAALAAIHVGLALTCHLGWATAFDRLRSLFARPAFWRVLEAGTGAALLALAWHILG